MLQTRINGYSVIFWQNANRWYYRINAKYLEFGDAINLRLALRHAYTHAGRV